MFKNQILLEKIKWSKFVVNESFRNKTHKKLNSGEIGGVQQLVIVMSKSDKMKISIFIRPNKSELFCILSRSIDQINFSPFRSKSTFIKIFVHFYLYRTRTRNKNFKICNRLRKSYIEISTIYPHFSYVT